MPTEAEVKELTINSNLDELDTSLEDGPADDEMPEAFLRRVCDSARALTGAIEQLTPDDVDEIWQEEV